MLYALKTFGRYYYFKSEEARNTFIATMPEYEMKHAECWTILLPERKV